MVDVRPAFSAEYVPVTAGPDESAYLRPMLYKTLSAAVNGIDASIIEVEVDISGVKTSEDHFHTVGLPDAAVRESRDRVRAALKNCGYDIPLTQITINLAPADIRKEGSGFDLPIALAVLAASRQVSEESLRGHAAVGELALDGRVRPVAGVLAAAEGAREQGLSRLFCAAASAPEAALAGIEPVPLHHLADLNRWRNIAAHHGMIPAAAPPLDLPSLQAWRSSCDGLASSLHGIMYNELRRILRRTPW